VFAVQEQIAQAVVTALKVKLLPGQAPTSKQHRTAHPEAYTQYLLGRQFFNRASLDGYRLAAQAYQKSIAIDPAFTPAWAGFAHARYFVAANGETAAEVAEGQRQALAAAEKAVTLAPDLAEAYGARGAIRSLTQWDWTGARADFERALALSPESAEAWLYYASYVLRPLGRLPEGIAAFRKATELDPLNGRAWATLGALFVCSGQLEKAREALGRSLEVNPEQAGAGVWLGILFLLEKQPAAALAAFERSTSETLRLAGAAVAHHDLDQPRDSQQALDTLIAKYSHSGAFQLGQVYAWRGDPDRAFQWLQRAYAQGDGGLLYLKIDPLLRSLRGDSRYVALLKKMNLPLD
jgi:tetratricopeptide (TPR) repeat protein